MSRRKQAVEKMEKIMAESDSQEQKSAQEESFEGQSQSNLGERIARVEGKLEREKTQEELYIERRQKYEKNIAARKAKEAKKSQFLQDLEDEG